MDQIAWCPLCGNTYQGERCPVCEAPSEGTPSSTGATVVGAPCSRAVAGAPDVGGWHGREAPSPGSARTPLPTRGRLYGGRCAAWAGSGPLDDGTP